MRVDPHPVYKNDSDIEAAANALLDRYHKEIEAISEPPVPVEAIADFLLELHLDWGPIEDEDGAPVLAYINAQTRAIRLNERRRAHFESFPGLYEFTLGHEIGHERMHVIADGSVQLEMPLDFAGAISPARATTLERAVSMEARRGVGREYLCRETGGAKDMRELQADIFAGYLLMPARLLGPALERVDLRSWRSLYQVRDRFHVSISALTVRLKRLGLLYIDSGGKLRESEAEANGQMRLL